MRRQFNADESNQSAILSSQWRAGYRRHGGDTRLSCSLSAGGDRTAPKRRMVVIFQRGAADGLNVVVPYREKNYYDMRPSIAIPQNQVIDLDGFFGLHPSLASFKPLYDQGHLAIVHAAGSPDMSRSHFDAQDFMESGTPGVKSTEDGWLNRALQRRRTSPHAGAYGVSRVGIRLGGSAHTGRKSSGHRDEQPEQLLSGWTRPEAVTGGECISSHVWSKRRPHSACNGRRNI